jgi:septum formation protein
MVQPLVLASQSPRRRELLGILGMPFSSITPSVDETPKNGESPESYVRRVAREKAMEVAPRVSGSLILSADTVVTFDGQILGKPADRADAIRMLERLSGREHQVFTAVCVVDQTEDEVREGVERTAVRFRVLTSYEIEDYVDREDVLDKAGAYAIQGLARKFIPGIEGSYSNVMGLPLALVFNLLCRT